MSWLMPPSLRLGWRSCLGRYRGPSATETTPGTSRYYYTCSGCTPITPCEGLLDVRTIVELAHVRWPGGPGVRAGVAVRGPAGFAEPLVRPGAGAPGLGHRSRAGAVDPGGPSASG